jgi:hypothetical protein
MKRLPRADLRRRRDWNAENAIALSKVIPRAPQLADLARLVIPRLPSHTLASDTLRARDRNKRSSGWISIDDAIECEHFAVNNHQFTNAIVVDIDKQERPVGGELRRDWQDRLDELCDGYGLPRPTWTCRDPWTGMSAHLVWMLRTPVLMSENGSEKPKLLVHIVRRLLNEAFGGDAAYNHYMTKNPWKRGRALTGQGEPSTL